MKFYTLLTNIIVIFQLVFVQGRKKYFARGVPQPFSIGHIMNFIPKESPSKMGLVNVMRVIIAYETIEKS